MITLTSMIYRWNFSFPTNAEKIAWRVFTLIAVGIAVIPGIMDQWPFFTVWLGKKNMLPPCMESLGNPTQRRTKFEAVLVNIFIYIYFLARLGTLALMLSSLRAQPPGIYITPDWLSSIPHV